MNSQSKIKPAWVLASTILALLTVSPVSASVVGSMNLNITGGCFSSGAAGTGAEGCGNTIETNLAYATGTFAFEDTLLSEFGGTAGLAAQPFSYEGIVNMQAGTGPGEPLFPFASESRSWGDWASLTSDPLMILGLALFETVASNPSGPQSFPFDFTLLGGEAFSLHWVLDNVVGDETQASGNFTAWSGQDLNWLSELLFEQPLPADANFAGEVVLIASTADIPEIPEPATLALVGLGVLGMSMTHRRRKLRQV